MKQRITGFHTDESGDWVAELECGHGQHVRHDPPWQLRPWVINEDTRQAHLGRTLECRKCDVAATTDFRRIGKGDDLPEDN